MNQPQHMFRILHQLEYLNLTNELSNDDPIIHSARGGNGDIFIAYVWIRGRKRKVAIKRLRFYIYKDKDFAKVRHCSVVH